MWSQTVPPDEAHLEMCRTHADEIASIVPMLLHYINTPLGYRNKLLVC